jgi:hypothetical protein
MDSRNADRKLKLDMARELHGFELFSLNQLAKIVRINVKFIAAGLKKNAAGGKFEPEALSTLIAIRQIQLTRGERVPRSLLRIALEADTSFSCVVRLTGISYGSYYKDVPAAHRRANDEE